MPVFQYVAFDDAGDTKQGIIDATTAREAREKLRSRKLFVTEMEAVKKGRANKKKETKRSGRSGMGRVPDSEPDAAGAFTGAAFAIKRFRVRGARQELVGVTRLLATLLKAGINLVDGITSVIQQVNDKHLDGVLRQVREDLKGGVSFGDSLAQHPELFDALYVNMVRAGEASGALDDVLSRLAGFLQAQSKMKNRVSAALAYPMIMCVMGGGVVAFLLAFVVPKIVKVVLKKGGNLPVPTKILITIQDLFLGWWWLALIIVILVWLAYMAYVSTEKGAMARDTYKLKIPIVGDLFRKQSVSRFAHTFATLLRSGVQATDCLKILANIVDNRLLGKTLADVRERILEGTDISTPLKKSKIFPPVVGDMIAIGEESGQLEELLERIAETYDEEVEITTQKATSLIEPLIIVAMAFVVGFIVLAIVLPLVDGFNF
ncbi:MAG: type II secretion system F family protein [Planctomycetes bacterium]|nr:type II secretion system F family protein [Planctomycetota bacterium]